MQKNIFLVTNLDQGGIETYLLRFLKYNNNQSYNIVICKSGRFGELYDNYQKYADKVIPLRFGYANLKGCIRFFKLVRCSKIDTICDFTGNFAGIPLWIGKLAGVERRIAFYRGSTNHFKETHIRLLYNVFVKCLVSISATKILSNSKAALDFFFPNRNMSSQKYAVIYNGVDMKNWHQDSPEKLRDEFHIDDKAFVVGHTGRCNEAKNHNTILKVAINLCHKHQNIHFVLVGKGVREKYLPIIQHEGLEGNIHLLGYRNDVVRILPLFDLYYFPSLTEGQPNALIEAMVTGLPIVASDIAPIQESVPKEMRRLLLPPCDVTRAVEVIEKMYLTHIDRERYRCTDWAKKQFDADYLFDRFQEEL